MSQLIIVKRRRIY
jgi:hypothetical protein